MRHIKELEQLTKEQLMWLIEQQNHILFIVGEELVRESKKEVSAEHVVEKIRELITNEYLSLNDSGLSDYIDKRLKK